MIYNVAWHSGRLLPAIIVSPTSEDVGHPAQLLNRP